MRRYYLHTRNGVFYAALINQETGLSLTAKSTGTKSRDEALLIVADWLKNGIPKGKQKKPRTLGQLSDLKEILKVCNTVELTSEDALAIAEVLKKRGLLSLPAVRPEKGKTDFIMFLREFWDYEKSSYIREKLALGHSIGKRHAYETTHRLHHYEPFFTGKKLESVTRADLKEFSMQLHGKGLSAKSVNSIMAVATVALRWAFQEKLIAENPAAGLKKFSVVSRKRDVLTVKEAGAVFAVEWGDERSCAANLVGATTGARMGEILALRKSDIDPVKPILYIRHSYSRYDKLKSPKNGDQRRAPLYPEVRDALEGLLRSNPYKDDPDPFIFYSILPGIPMDGKPLLDGLRTACKDAKIDLTGRNIVFHSWRHFYASRLADKMEAEKVQRITGHKSRTVFDAYAAHVEDVNLEEMRKAGAEVFGTILKFEKGA